MENQKYIIDQNYLNQVKKQFNLDDFSSIQNNRDAFVSYTRDKLRYWLIIEYYNYFEGEHFSHVHSSINSFLEDGDKIFSRKDYVPVTIGNFENDLSNELQYVPITQDSPADIKVKIEAYKKFLIEVESNFTCVDVLNFDCQIELFDSKVIDTLLSKLIKKLFDFEQIFFDLGDAFITADRSFKMTMMSFDKNNYLKKYKKNESTFFILGKYIDPVELREFPKERLQFHKIVKTILNKQLEIRKTALNWDKTPEEYKCIEEFAQELTVTQKVESQPIIAPEATQTIIQNEEDYPRHIFINKKAFILFEELNEGIDSSIQISFLYRMMAEKDKLIVVKDTPFRDWYNTNNYKIKLMNTTKTLEQAKNKDRELWYNKVKALIYNK